MAHVGFRRGAALNYKGSGEGQSWIRKPKSCPPACFSAGQRFRRGFFWRVGEIFFSGVPSCVAVQDRLARWVRATRTYGEILQGTFV